MDINESKKVEGAKVSIRGYPLDARSAALTRGRNEDDYEFLIQIRYPSSIEAGSFSICGAIVDGKYLGEVYGPTDQRRDRQIMPWLFVAEFNRLEKIADLVPFLEGFMGRELPEPPEAIKELTGAK
ncbi:hypothetical protein CMI45_03380 [Candidatus Pacearchaeota archaeon]|nr:hypothetical protein [Candidatus Pacearchaeota archaeon]|tara:strand:+ start:804 stop:1181 length:378 start_codon:yes stop_codon:yes gene_type:complete